MGYEYNDGTMYFGDSDKTAAKWPACVKELREQAGKKWLEWFRLLQPIDPSVDVRNEYKVTVVVK
jgi:hypothetical protein